MAGDWIEVPLGELAQNFDSRRVPLSSREREKRHGRYPYYGATGILDYVDDFLFEGLHLLVAEDGSVERPDGKPFVQLADGRFWVNNHAHVLSGATDEETKFLYYALQTVAIGPFVSGSVQAKLSQANLNRIPTPYPTNTADRHTIVHILGTLDDRIDLNQQMNQTLESIAQTIFKQWFIDFEFPDDEGRPYRSSGGEMVYSETLGREVPASWNAGKVRDFVVQLKEQVSPFEEAGELYHHFSIEAFDTGKVPIPQLGSEILSNKFQVHDRTVLVSKLNPRIQRVWPIIKSPTNGICSTEFLVFRPESVAFSFFYSLITSAQVQRGLVQMARGTSSSHQRVSAGDILDLPTIVPSQRAIELFERTTLPSLARREQNLASQSTLRQIRDSLLPKLVSGKVRVPVEVR